MELIEIRNNLVKLSYSDEERPILGQFIALTGDDKSYVAQFVNLKADNINNFAVARLMFSFTSDGVVSEYDGSAPSIHSNLVNLPANELLDLLPVETPLRIGQISGSPDILNTDISIFEHNFTVFCEKDTEKAILISNCVRQLFRLKEKSVIIDTDSIFGDYPKISVGEDFKLPLNSDFIDFIFNYELKDVDAPTKAIIQDIFYAVQQYIKTLDDEFLPIENFIDVVTAQYKETQMPELALLKNKLLKYKDAGIFANDASEYKELEEKLKEKNCIVINLKDLFGELQKEIITYIHKMVDKFDKYVYYFVSLKDDNSDKKLLKRLLNHNHIFTTIFASHQYKYASELKAHAQNIMFFAPMTLQHDFAAYNTFLNKLSPSEGVIYGKLTQGIPLIISLDDLDLDLTKEDVFGDRLRFVPAIEEDALNSDEIYAINNIQETPNMDNLKNLYDENYAENNEEESNEQILQYQENEENIEPKYQEEHIDDSVETESIEHIHSDEIPSAESDENVEIPELSSEEENNEIELANDEDVSSSIENEDLSFMDDFASENDNEDSESGDSIADIQSEDDTLMEEDLDFIESEGQILDNSDEDTTPVVPVYNTDEDEENLENSNGIKAGDQVSHPRYGNGVVEKIIKYGNKTLCSIDFENVGRRLLDPSVSDFQKI